MVADSVYKFFINLLSRIDKFDTEADAKQYISDFVELNLKKKQDQAEFIKKFKIVPTHQNEFEIKFVRSIQSEPHLESPTLSYKDLPSLENFPVYKYKVQKRLVDISTFNLKPTVLLNKAAQNAISQEKETMLETKTHPVILYYKKKIIHGRYSIYALRELGYKKIQIIIIKDRELRPDL